MNLNRRDVLKGLAALGISLTAAPTLAAESEEWRQKENGVYVMPEAEAITPFEMIGMVIGRDGIDAHWSNSSFRWQGFPQPDGSIRLVFHPYYFDRHAARDPGAGKEILVPASFAPCFVEFASYAGDDLRPCVLATKRLKAGATRLPPLGPESFRSTLRCRDWKIIDDRSGVLEKHAPFNCVIAPDRRYDGWGETHERSRHTETYLAQVVWRDEDGNGNPLHEADRIACTTCAGEGVEKYAGDDGEGNPLLWEEACADCEGKGWW